MSLTQALPTADEPVTLEELIAEQQQRIQDLQAKIDECCPDECPCPEEPPPADCDTDLLRLQYQQAQCDCDELIALRRKFSFQIAEAKFAAKGTLGELLYADLSKLLDIEITVANALVAEAYAAYMSCVSLHAVQCRNKLCEDIVSQAACIDKLDPECIEYVQTITGKSIW